MLRNITNETQTLIACCGPLDVYIYNLRDISSCTVVDFDSIVNGGGKLTAIEFLSQHEIILAITDRYEQTTLAVCDTQTKTEKTIDIGNVEVLGLTIANPNTVLFISPYRLGKWEIKENRYEWQPYDYPVEICVIDQNQFVVCSSETELQVWTVSPFQLVKRLQVTVISVDKYKGGIIYLDKNVLWQLDIDSEQVTEIMKISGPDQAYTKVVDQKIAFAFEFVDKSQHDHYCSIYNLETKEVEVKEAFYPMSTTYKPFVTKGSLIMYYEDYKVKVYDVSSRKQVCEIEANNWCKKFTPESADLALW
jgi:hypothetical protein